MFPRFRSHPLVQNGVSYWYIGTCLAQIGWTFAFAYEIIWLSLVLMVAILATLFAIAWRQYYQYNNPENPKRVWDFWLLILPFALHFGWIICATAVNTNVLVVSMGQPAAIQLCVGIISLAVLHAVALWALYFPYRAQYTIPCVISWANGAIASELTNPKNLITQTFSNTIIESIRLSSAAVSIIVLILITSRLCFSICRRTLGRNEERFERDYDAEQGVRL